MGSRNPDFLHRGQSIPHETPGQPWRTSPSVSSRRGESAGNNATRPDRHRYSPDPDSVAPKPDHMCQGRKFAIDADPVVNDVIDVQCLTQIDDQLLELVKPVCDFEPLQQAVQFVSHQCAPGLQGSRMSTLFLPMPLPRLHASGPSQEENRSGTRRTPSRPEHQLSTFVRHSQFLTIR